MTPIYFARASAIALSLLSFTSSSIAQPPSTAAAALAEFDATINKMQDAFAQVPGDARDKDWVIKKLQHMVDMDQYMRSFILPNDRQLTTEEQTKVVNRFQQLDRENTAELKSLLSRYSWFTIRKFGKKADNNAWLLVQHADHDPAFQQEILEKLEKLYPQGESRPQNYAYLYDRLAASWHDPAKRRPQRYGTQGTCTGPGKWEPLPIEDPDHVDTRRASVGLPPLAEYVAGFKDVCK